MSEPKITTSRRSVLRGAGIAVAAGATVSACGQDDPAPSAAPTSSAATPTGASGGSGGASLGAAAEVPVGGGKIYADAKVVVTQPEKGTFKAFSTRCPHAGCAVSALAGRTITCPCHGSAFSIADGSPTQGPATEPLEGKTVTVEGGNLSIA
jgi:nitrite reductase/ring-hydroxylating ferredoxin subunit